MSSSAETAAAAVDESARARRLTVIAVLGFASGLPLALSGGALQAWFTTSGVSLKAIGWATLIGQAYVFKPLWAPLIDRYALPLLGRRRGWILACQLACAACLFGMSLYDPSGSMSAIVFLAVLLAVFSATQDIAFDAYRTDVLVTPEQRNWGSALTQAGYRLAMLTSGGLALILADQLGWPLVYQLMAALMLVASIGTLAAPAAAPVSPPRDLLQAVVAPLRAFFTRPAVLAWIALIILYKLADAFSLALSTTFLLRGVGFSQTEVGSVNKFVGLAAGLGGSLLGGWMLMRMRLVPALLIFGIAQALTNLGFAWLTLTGPDLPALVLVVLLDQAIGGMGSTAFGVLVMALCDQRFSATQFALISALAVIGRVYLGPLAATVVEAVGWGPFFVTTVFTAIPGLLMVYVLRSRIAALDVRGA
ncbi:AmpG family muropeptide MFS transporter [Tahibacter caeni]|uniref:AmpG family muropeptide MFS transporter n=1 Tax=Tahibacter caeni TaxID=1453545 RepID=UPI002148DB12|nr:MFS transporter [Tahibacter caeni]